MPNLEGKLIVKSGWLIVDPEEFAPKVHSPGEPEIWHTLEQVVRGMILIGGRVLERGTVKNPLGLGLRANFSAPYPFVKQDQDETTGKEFQKKIKSDHIDLTWTDQKRQKLVFNEVVDAKSAEVNGPGISQAEIDICS